MPSKAEEDRARDTFSSFLTRSFASDQIVWRNGSEPPDHWLDLGGESFAVEVTALRKRYDIGGGIRLPLRAMGRELEALVSRVERELVVQNCIRGKYAVQIFRAIPDLKKLEPEILALIRATVTDLEEQAIGAKKPFMRVAQRTCSIVKLDSDGAALVLWGPTDSMWLAEATVEMREMIRERIVAKRDKLRAIKNLKILVLDDQYLYSELEMFSALDLRPEEFSGFHTVYVARSGRESVVLHSSFADA